MGKWDKYKKNKPENNDSNSVNNGMVKTVINWLITIYPRIKENLGKIRDCEI